MKILCISKYEGLGVVKKPFYQIEAEMDFEYFYSLNQQAVNEFDLVIVDGECLAENRILNLFFLKENSFKQLLILNMQKLKFNANHLDQGYITIVQSKDELIAKLKELGAYEEETIDSWDEFAVTQMEEAKSEVDYADEEVVVEKIGDDVLKQVEVASVQENKKPLFKMPQISMPTALNFKKGRNSELGNVAAHVEQDSRIEYGFIGATNGVGNTSVALLYAQELLSRHKRVAFVTINKLEYDVLPQAFKKIQFFFLNDYSQAIYKNDCIIYDYGVLDLNNPARLREWERCQKRYIVTNLSPIKKHSINKIFQYVNQSSVEFEVVFNFLSDIKAIQNTFKELKCVNMPFTNLS